MGYYVRAFGPSPKVPELAAIQRWLRERGSTAVLDEPTHAVEVARSAAPSTPILALDTSEWEQVGVAYKPGDRKSTRLNSSHLVISYAVFCLKKKKTKEQHHTFR